MKQSLPIFRVFVFVCAALVSLRAPLAHAEQTWTINFKDTELEEVVRFVAQATGKTIIVDPKAKGRVQVISSQPLNQAQLYDLFLSILDVNGFTAVDSGGVLRIVPSRDAKSAGAPVVINNKQRDNSEIVTEVIQLKNISATTLIPVLRPLAPQQAHMAAHVPSNAIIISDAASNIASIRAVIDRLDRAASGETEIMKLQHASAEEVVRMLDQLEKGDPSKAQGEAAGKTVVMVADKRTNSILISGDAIQRQRLRALVAHLDGPLAQSGNVAVVYLQYAKAKDLATVLNKVMQNVAQMQPSQTTPTVSGKGKATIEADEGTNSLIVTADADVMSSLQAVIERLDIRRAQVLVEAIIVEMSSSKERDLGIQWMFSNSSGAYGSSSMDNGLLGGTAAAAFGVAPTTGTGSNGNTGTAPVDPRLALGQVLAGTKGQVLGIGRIGDNLSFNAVLNALQQNTDANILSTPSLLTLDNEEASIVVGQEVPFKTGSYTSTGNATAVSSPFETIQRENVGLTLKVTPHINEGDSLILEISQEVSSLTGAASTFEASDVITNERKIESKVLADNGQVIVLGGLIKDDVQETAQKVPLLGDIPFLGRLFRNSSATKTKTNLMVFLRPVIVRDSRVLTGATGEKYKFIRDEQLDIRERGSDYLKKKDLPLLPEWELQLRKIQEMQLQKQQKESSTIDKNSPAAPAGDTAPGASAP